MNKRKAKKGTAAKYPIADAIPETQQSFGLSRKTVKRINGKYANTQGVASARYSTCSRLLAKKAIPAAGKSDSSVRLQYHNKPGTIWPERIAWFTTCKSHNSKTMSTAAARRPYRAIAEPSAKIRTATRRAKNSTNEITARIRFFSLLSSAPRNAGDVSLISLVKVVISVRRRV